jgi:nucleoside-diphosphate-sugar epimerase
LQIALKLAGVEVNDVALTFIAIANAISYCSAAANLIADLMGKEIKIILDNDRIRPKDSEVERLFASNAKAKDLFGWKPSEPGLAGFESGLKKTIDGFINPENLANYKSSIFKI